MRTETMLERIHDRPVEDMLRERIAEWGDQPGLVTRLAVDLSIAPMTVYSLLDKYGIDTPTRKAKTPASVA